METNSLKEYYIKLQTMYQNAVNILTAINQSLSTSSSEVTVTMVNDNNTHSEVRIPSFLYLENKLEQLNSNFDTLFNMPKSGEAWFQQNATSNMYKLQMVKSSSAPQIPVFSSDNLGVQTSENNIMKDLVNPKTFIRLNISNLTDNISQIYMRKIVFNTVELFNALQKMNLTSYNEVKSALFTYTKDVDYTEYDSVINTPLKKDTYKSSFQILDIVNKETNENKRLQYTVHLDTIEYTDADDSSIVHNLKNGDYLTLPNNYAIYKIVNISTSYTQDNADENYVVTLEEYVGHVALQTVEENSDMIFELYNSNYNTYHYVDIPLEENPYIAVFIGTIHNGIRSELSKPLLLNLYNVYMKDENGNVLTDTTTKSPISYIDFYNKYCNNIGDLIDAIATSVYPQISTYNTIQLNELENSPIVQTYVTGTIEGNNTLNVKKINNHLADSVSSNEIKQLHAQKAELSSQLTAIQDNIDQIYNQLTTTDFSQNSSVTQESLRSQLNTYYTERITLQKQVIAIINQIDALKGNVNGEIKSKYRIRGVTQVTNLIDYLKKQYGNKIDIVGADIQYKYKGVNANTSDLTSINSTVITDWNKYITTDRQRYLKFDSSTNMYTIDFVDYGNSVNIIKWNQIDIPIQYGEDVTIRVRYKYNIGQPFINLYTPWSDEITINFPTELQEDNTLSDIISTNNDDVVDAKFQQTLINGGYSEHINNKIVDNSQIFYHMPENIYSGFTTAENKMISLKDELRTIVSQLDEYRSLMHNELNSKFKVYLEYDNNSVEIIKGTQNNITINETTNGLNDTFIKKHMNIVFKNIGDTSIKFYSIFPGDPSIPLLQDQQEFEQLYLPNYDRVPLLYGNSNIPLENITLQKMGQWVYFRNNNPYSKRPIYFNSAAQNQQDLATYRLITDDKTSNKPTHFIPNHYNLEMIKEDFNQPTVGYVIRNTMGGLLWNQLEIRPQDNSIYTAIINGDYDYSNVDPSIFIYDDEKKNNYILKYEHLVGTEQGKDIYMSTDMSFNTFKDKANNLQHYNSDIFVGAFLIPELLTERDLQCAQKDEAQYTEILPSETLTIPVIFEYYLTGSDNTPKEITKGLYFDVRPSLFKDPIHFMINVTAKYNYTVNNADIINMSNPLIDTVTEK